MNRFSFTFQLSMAFLLIISIILSAVFLIDYKMNEVLVTASKVEKLRIPTAQNSARLKIGMYHSLASLRGWMILGDPKFKEERKLAWKEEILISLQEMNRLSPAWTNTENVQRLSKINELIKKFKVYQQEVEDADDKDANNLLANFASPTAEAILFELNLMVINQRELLSDDFKTHKKNIDDLLKKSIFLSIFGIIVVIFLELYIIKIFSSWMKFTKEISQKIGDGNFTEKVSLSGPSEIIELSGSLKLMREKLNKMNYKLNDEIQTKTLELQESVGVLKITQKQMMDSEEMASLGNLVAGVTHEISTPIGSSLMGISQLISMHKELKSLYKEQKMTQKDFDDYLNLSGEVNDSIQINLEHIIELLQSFKQVSADQSSNKVYEFSIYEKINQIILSLYNRFKNTKIKISVDCNEGYIIKNNPGTLSQIFINLITNSLIHAFEQDEEGTIQFKVFEKDYKTHILYKDSGKGMSEEVLENLFEPFFTTNRENGGTGLGMYIIKNLVHENLKGTITVKSKEGDGVEFEIIF